MKKIEFLLLLIIILGAFLVRLYRIDNPIADWHSWRQADTSAVSRNFVKLGFDLLHPRFDDLSKIPSGKENPQGYRFVEFPIYNVSQAGFYKLFGTFSLEVWGRLVTIFSSILSILFLYLLIRKRLGDRIALFAAAFFAFLPFNIYYGRTILPDSSMVMAILGGTYFFERWIEESTKLKAQSSKLQLKMQIFFVLSIFFTASAFLLKPFALFFTLPMIYLAFEKWGANVFKKPTLWMFILLTLSPLIAWRIWMQQYPEGIAANDWLFNANNIRFKGAFFYWIFADRLGRLILGYWGIALLVVGLVRKIDKREGLFFLSFLTSSLFYLFVIAGGNVQHDYYQILIIPTIAIFLGKGADLLLSAPPLFNLTISRALLPICAFLMLGFSWFFIRDYFNINNSSIVVGGKVADKILPKDAKVIAPYNGDTSFLYQTNRQGWPVVDRPIEEMIKRGAEYLVIASPTKSDLEGFGRMYPIVSSSTSYLILKLK